MTPDSQFTRRVKIIVPFLSVAVIAAFALAGWSFYSAHQQACESRNQSLDVLRDVIVIATTPDRGRDFSAEQLERVRVFRAATFGRINQARC